ncbi:MAG TPA: RDD family protein [Thermoanaerobaculia bacterium]
MGTAGEVVPAPENPYRAPRARVDRPLVARYDPLAGMVMARRLTRLGAAMIDGVTYLVPVVLGVLISGDLKDFATADPEQGEISMILLRRLFIFALPIMLINVYLLAKSGQTMGKKALGIRIVRTDGAAAGLARLLVLRSLLPSMLSWILFIGGFFGLLDTLFIFGEERRCIHDHFADTMVALA